uniref:Uncharacterized protein n=1 Tax=Heterorhabditis bacteriophora TaxID=37862 RepID=A0A1I7XNT5_HETBA
MSNLLARAGEKMNEIEHKIAGALHLGGSDNGETSDKVSEVCLSRAHFKRGTLARKMTIEEEHSGEYFR